MCVCVCILRSSIEYNVIGICSQTCSTCKVRNVSNLESELGGQSQCYKIYIDLHEREIKIVLWCWMYNTAIAHVL